MNYKENIKKDFNDSKKMNLFRLKGAVLLFAIINFLFFLDYIFSGAGFYSNISILILPYLFVLLLLSYLFLVFFAFKYRFPNLNKIHYILVFIGLLMIFLLFSIFIIFGKNIF